MNRYDADGIEGQHRPGSDGQVLQNKQGIVDPSEMDQAELYLLNQLYQWLFNKSFPEGVITTADIKHWHRKWLGNLYEWAGEERSVNLAKGDFHFAASARIPALLVELDGKFLSRLTPCSGLDDDQLVTAIAQVHVEFILLHPFREGNGRMSRLLADVMAVQAGKEPLDYSAWDQDRDGYFQAIQQGLDDYGPMERYVRLALLP